LTSGERITELDQQSSVPLASHIVMSNYLFVDDTNFLYLALDHKMLADAPLYDAKML